MTNFLYSLPRALLVFILLVAGIAVVVFSNPPHTICDTQAETIRETLKGSVFLDPARPKIKTTGIRYRHDLCWRLNDSGGCYEYFASLRSTIKDLKTVSPRCWTSIGEIKEIKTALHDAVELFIRVAWGAKPPSTFMERFGWLSAADVALYCDIQSVVSEFYGRDGFVAQRETLITSLPGVERMRREDIWSRSLMSVNCDQYR
jgi:hypothetical protein